MKKEAFIYLKEVKTFRLIYKMTDSDFESQLKDDENSFQNSDEESLNEEGEQNFIRRALSKIAKGMGGLAGPQIERTKLMIEADKKRDEFFLKHKQMRQSEPVNIKPKKPVKIENTS